MFRKTESCSLFATAAFHMSVFLAIPCLFSEKASQTRSCDSVASAFLSATRNRETPGFLLQLLGMFRKTESCSLFTVGAPQTHLTDQFFSQCLVSSSDQGVPDKSRSSQGREPPKNHMPVLLYFRNSALQEEGPQRNGVMERRDGVEVRVDGFGCTMPKWASRYQIVVPARGLEGPLSTASLLYQTSQALCSTLRLCTFAHNSMYKSWGHYAYKKKNTVA
eukprot:g67180.t1